MTSAPVLAQTEDTVVPPAARDAENSAECQRILDSPEFAALDEYVVEGRGSMIGDHNLGEALVGVDCSHSQIIAYMEREGFTFEGTEEWPEAIGPAFAPYTTRITFCARATTLLNKLLRRDCAVVASFHLLESKVTRIASAALK